jgi:tetratricopeptide (TPR) repeat protein
VAIRLYRKAVASMPVAQYLTELGEAEEAAGRMAAARRHYTAAEAKIEAERTRGVRIATELAVFEATHGDTDSAVAAGRRAWRAAPSVRSADAYAWALSEAGEPMRALTLSRQAMRLGSRDPMFLFHAGLIARRAGRYGRACSLLTGLLEQTPRFNPLYVPVARRARATACGSPAG